MADTVLFGGREWVDATIEYFKLPPSLQISDNKWDRRLRALGIRYILPDVRSTARGNIADLVNGGRAQKSKYVVKSVWDAAVAQAHRRMDEEAQSNQNDQADGDATRTVNNGDNQGLVAMSLATASEPQALANFPTPDASTGPRQPQIQDDVARSVVPIPLTHNECFHHNGQRMNIRVYGERTVDGLLLNARDVCESIGFRYQDMPDRIPVETVDVCGSLTQTVSWEAFIFLVFLKADGHIVANEIKRWIVDTVFAVQFQGGAHVASQAEYASRTSRFSSATYTGALSRDDFIIYAIDAFSAQALEDKYPGAVVAIAGDRIDTSRIIKIGIGKRERVQATRSDLNQILPGHDPRPILVLKVRGVADTDELKVLFEDAIFEEFADHRIGHDGRMSVMGPRNRNYTEMVVVDPDTKEQIVRRMVSMVDDHHEKLWERTKEEVRNAQAESHVAIELKMQLQLKDADMRTKDMENTALKEKCKASDERCKASDERCKASDERCKKLETTLTQVLPRKLSVLKHMFRTSD